jgi:hypothetical protein
MNYLLNPGLLRAGWESVLLYPLLLSLADDDGFIDSDYIDPDYLSSITKAPVEVTTAGITGLLDGFLLGENGGFRVAPLSRTHARGHADASASRVLKDEGLQGARGRSPARVSAPARTRGNDAPMCAYLRETWGELVDRGKPLASWAQAQEDAHPQLDLLAEAKKARAWEMSQKKKKTSIRRFLANWFNRAAGYDKEVILRAEGGPKHWSGLNRRDRDKAVSEGHHEHSMLIDGVSVVRDLRDDMFILSGQDMTDTTLPFRGVLYGIVLNRLENNGDPHDPDPMKAALKSESARSESDRALFWAVGQIVTDARYELGLLPV